MFSSAQSSSQLVRGIPTPLHFFLAFVQNIHTGGRIPVGDVVSRVLARLLRRAFSLHGSSSGVFLGTTLNLL